MVTQTQQTGVSATSAPRQSRKVGSKIAYVLGLGCCMKERKPKKQSTPGVTPIEEFKTEANWSTSTLGLEHDLTYIASPSMEDARQVPLSSMEFFAAAPAPPPYVARPNAQPRKKSQNSTRTDTLEPVITITDPDIATGTTKSARKNKKTKQKKEKISTLEAWSQIDPMYSMYQQERSNRAGRQCGKKNRFEDIRAFDFMSYGGWIVM